MRKCIQFKYRSIKYDLKGFCSFLIYTVFLLSLVCYQTEREIKPHDTDMHFDLIQIVCMFLSMTLINIWTKFKKKKNWNNFIYYQVISKKFNKILQLSEFIFLCLQLFIAQPKEEVFQTEWGGMNSSYVLFQT